MALQSILCKGVREIRGVLWNLEVVASVVERAELTETQQRELEEVLGQYPQVFRELNGLPPIRRIVHSIILHSGTGLVSVRPYRYPH